MRAPGGQEAQQEIETQFKRFGYKAELYGVKHRSADLVEAVFQPWYQDMLDMGSIQVFCHGACIQYPLTFLQTLAWLNCCLAHTYAFPWPDQSQALQEALQH